MEYLKAAFPFSSRQHALVYTAQYSNVFSHLQKSLAFFTWLSLEYCNLLVGSYLSGDLPSLIPPTGDGKGPCGR